MKEQIDAILKAITFLERIDPTQKLKEDLGIDSLSMVEMIVELEEKFDIEINESDLNPDELRTVEQIYELVGRYKEG